MAQRAKRLCRHVGCSALVDLGYCELHARPAGPRESFKRLDEKKTNDQRSFYSSRRWTETSRSHRRNEPLCRACKSVGKVTAGEMVHHDPELEILLQNGFDPFDDKYLVTLCNNCHLAELRKKKARL
jgi:5-methylcytosine-specific restriction endonuclease McrA